MEVTNKLKNIGLGKPNFFHIWYKNKNVDLVK